MRAMQDEMKFVHDNLNYYYMVDLPKGKSALKNKCIYNIKHEENNTQARYKVRLVVKDFR